MDSFINMAKKGYEAYEDSQRGQGQGQGTYGWFRPHLLLKSDSFCLKARRKVLKVDKVTNKVDKVTSRVGKATNKVDKDTGVSKSRLRLYIVSKFRRWTYQEVNKDINRVVRIPQVDFV